MNDGMDDSNGMDDLILQAYRHVVESGRWNRAWLSQATGAPPTKIDEVQRNLIELSVIEREHGPADSWRAISPRIAIAKVVTPIDHDVRRYTARAETLRRRLQMLVPAHQETDDVLDRIEVIPDDEAVRALVEDEAARCTDQLIVLQTETHQPVDVSKSAVAAQERGVRVRAVFQHAARYSQPTVETLEPLITAGAEVRTANTIPMQLLVFSRTACVLLVSGRGAAAGGPAGLVVRHPDLVAVLLTLFETVWTQGARYDHGQPQPDHVLNEFRRSILQLLATGAKDDAVARRLGISLRTCRRHISEISRLLGASSRFQAGVEAHRRDLL